MVRRIVTITAIYASVMPYLRLVIVFAARA
jgi:hypothetical protein